MKLIPALAVGLAFVGALSAAPARAQNRAFVSAGGSDSNACSFVAPCRSLQHAHDTVTANGEIDVLDPAGYGSLIINRAISINGHGYAEILVGGGGTGITINAPNTTDKINLSGLTIDGQGVGSTGINFTAGGSLLIDHCVLRNLVNNGIVLAPAARASMVVSDTLSADNGGDGILAQPSNSSSRVDAFFNRVQVYHNGQQGLAVSGTLSGGNVAAYVVDSVAGNNSQSGFYFIGPAAVTNSFASVFRSVSQGNQRGLHVENGITVRVSQTNFDTDDWEQVGFGCILTFGDNYGESPGAPPCSAVLGKQ